MVASVCKISNFGLISAYGCHKTFVKQEYMQGVKTLTYRTSKIRSMSSYPHSDKQNVDMVAPPWNASLLLLNFESIV